MSTRFDRASRIHFKHVKPVKSAFQWCSVTEPGRHLRFMNPRRAAAVLSSRMNNSGVMPQEKMELDLEIPAALVQSDGHLRRSNSAPMINGLRFCNSLLIFHLSRTSFDWMSFSTWVDTITAARWLTGHVHSVVAAITLKSSRERSYVVAGTALQLSTDPTWYFLLLSHVTAVCALNHGVLSLLMQVPSSPIRVPSTRLHQIKQVRSTAVAGKQESVSAFNEGRGVVLKSLLSLICPPSLSCRYRGWRLDI